MKFGVREICDVVFKAKKSGSLGGYSYIAKQPVLYIDSAKASTIESAATTVYAQGGKGNSRLIAWEGEKTLTFTVEDALLSERGLAILTEAGLINKKAGATSIHRLKTIEAEVSPYNNKAGILYFKEDVLTNMPIFLIEIKEDGAIGDPFLGFEVNTSIVGSSYVTSEKIAKGTQFFADYYVSATTDTSEFVIDVSNFAGYWYVEATTNFRRQADGKDLKAALTLPNVKIQSNFTFNMAATGDPSTFTFTMDAMPGYTVSNKKKEVLCEILIVDEDGMGVDNDATDNDSIITWQNIESEVEYNLNSVLFKSNLIDKSSDAASLYYDQEGAAITIGTIPLVAMKYNEETEEWVDDPDQSPGEAEIQVQYNFTFNANYIATSAKLDEVKIKIGNDEYFVQDNSELAINFNPASFIFSINTDKILKEWQVSQNHLYWHLEENAKITFVDNLASKYILWK